MHRGRPRWKKDPVGSAPSILTVQNRVDGIRNHGEMCRKCAGRGARVGGRFLGAGRGAAGLPRITLLIPPDPHRGHLRKVIFPRFHLQGN